MNNKLPFVELNFNIESISLIGNLRLADNNMGIILFSHGSGSGRLSSRNNYVADLLLDRGYSSLLFDLLTEEEDMIYENRFDIDLLTKRLIKVTDWISEYAETKHLPIGYFGSSTGAASALCAGVLIGNKIKAIVSRGGRPDLAMTVLHFINIPTLLIVGGKDKVVLDLNKIAQAEINGICELVIVEGAAHLFEEEGKLKEVAEQSAIWFDKYLIN